MEYFVEVHDKSRLKCKLCARFTSRSQIMRHLQGFHKVCAVTANSLSSEARASKKPRLTCALCGKLVGSLTKHLKEVHNETKDDATVMLKTIKKTKKLQAESQLSSRFIQDLRRFVNYSDKNKGYKRESKYTHCRIENIKRIALKFAANGEDFSDFLYLPHDAEIEEALEVSLLDFIDQMKEEGKAADTAVVYLNDIKKFISFFYRYQQRIPFIKFLNEQIAHCKSSRKGKLNLNKYSNRIDLVNKLKKHYACPLAVKVRGLLSALDSVTESPSNDPRDYLIARLVIENMQRPGAICNMKIEEFNDSIKTTAKKVTVVVEEHKTATTSGPANIHMSSDMQELLTNYIKYVRPKSDSLYVFLTAAGNAVSSSCCWGLLSRHFSKCKIGLDSFNVNSWRRAGNTVIQETGNEQLIEATARQLTHSRLQGRTTYYNDVSASKSAVSHDKIMDIILPEDTNSPLKSSLQEPNMGECSTPTPKNLPNIVPISPLVGAVTPTQGKQKRYFRPSDRNSIINAFEDMISEGASITTAMIKRRLDANIKKKLREGRTVSLSDDQLVKRIYGYLKSTKKKKIN